MRDANGEIFEIKVDDLAPDLSFYIWQESTGKRVDFTDYDTVTFTMVLKGVGSEKISDRALTVGAQETDDDGDTYTKLTLSWQSGDTDTAGAYAGEVTATASGESQTFPSPGSIDVVVADHFA